jgi:anti-sigma factor (TIGR02949 family)
MSCEHVERDLDTYLDRELDAESAMAVRDHLGRCEACRRKVAEREALGRLVRAAPYYSAPDRLRARVLAQTTRSRSVRRVLTWAAAAVLIVSVGGGMGLLRSALTRGDAIADEVVNSHVRSLMANHLFDVESTDQHTVKPWFLGKIDFSPPVADLASFGFPLVGGRLDYLGGRPAAALVYRRQKHTINVFVAPERDDPFARADARSLRGFHIHHWTHDGMSFWAVSDLNDAELTAFVKALRSS